MTRVALSLLFVCLVIGCDDKSARVSPPGPSATAVATTPVVLSPADEARDLWSSRCMMCHGATGRGDGPTAATLNPKPRDFANTEWQKATTDTQLKTVIVKGGPSTGKSALMPPNPDLEGKPEVVAQLVQIIRGYGK